jgi:hypothetical protein
LPFINIIIIFGIFSKIFTTGDIFLNKRIVEFGEISNIFSRRENKY